MNSPSYKKFLIHQLSSATTADILKNNDVILVTAAGIIQGKLSILEETEEVTTKAVFDEMLKGWSDDYRSTYNIDTDSWLPGNDGAIALTDVTILYDNGKKAVLPYLVVFFDQIIGITFGDISNNSN